MSENQDQEQQPVQEQKVSELVQKLNSAHTAGKLIGTPVQYHANNGENMHTPTLPAQIYSYHGKGSATLVVHNGETAMLKKAMVHDTEGKPAPGSWSVLG